MLCVKGAKMLCSFEQPMLPFMFLSLDYISSETLFQDVMMFGVAYVENFIKLYVLGALILLKELFTKHISFKGELFC